MKNTPSKSRQPPTSNIIVTAARSRLVRATNQLNLFSKNPFWSSALTYSEQILSTRLYIIFICLSLLITFVYACLSIRTHDVILEKFSLADFERIEARYPATLDARCTGVSNSYYRFLHLSPRFHPICSSPFIEQKWISSVSLNNATSHNILDFRTFTFAQFRALALLCQTARQAVHDAHRTFNSTRLVTNRVLSRVQFNEISVALALHFQNNIIAKEKEMSRIVSMNIASNGILSSLRTNYYIHAILDSGKYITYDSVYLRVNHTSKSTCNCRFEQNQCIYPAGAFYNWTLLKINEPAKSTPSPRFQIPGLMAGCLPLESIRQSTLECFYNQSCINILVIQPKISQPRALKPSQSNFSIHSTIGTLFDEFLFVESWQNTSSYEKYFPICKPRSLSYSYEDHFYLAAIFTMCITVWGGLPNTWQLITPAIVKIYKLIKWKKQQTQSSVASPQTDIELTNTNKLSETIPKAVTTHVRRTIYAFNLFPPDNENDTEEERVGIIATRLYILFLCVGLLIFGFYAFLIERTKINIVSTPSLVEFEQLNQLHSSSLICSCSRFSMSHARIISLVPRYHQICSSDFLKECWLSYFNDVEVTNQPIDFTGFDFRIYGLLFFQLIRTYCRLGNDTVQNALRVFESTRLVTLNTLSRTEFDQEMNARVTQFQERTIASVGNLIKLIHSSIQTNHLMTDGWTSSRILSKYNNRTSKWLVNFTPRNFTNDSCSCALSSKCTLPVGFYPRSITNYSRVNTTVPGLVLGCYLIDSVFSSTLECLFERQCMKLLTDMYFFDVVDLVRPLNNCVLNIQPLRHENSRFFPNTTMQSIVEQLFIENWTTSINFEKFYEYCAPKTCTYPTRRRFDTVYMTTKMFGFYGGLSVVLEFVLPLLVKYIRKRWGKRASIHHSTTDICVDLSMPTKSSRLSNQIFRRLASLNLFSSETSSNNKEIERQEILATYIYIVLLLLCLIAAVLYAGPFNPDTTTTVIEYPTPDVVNHLHFKNISTLSCPCSTVAVPYHKLVSIKPTYYSICSSQYVSPSYWSNLYEKNDSVSIQLSAHYRVLASLCQAAHRTIESAQQIFGTNELINTEVITSISFQTYINTAVARFISQIPADFRRTLSYIIGSFGVNQLLNIFSSNWQAILNSKNEVISTYPRRFSSSNCTCSVSSNCTEQLSDGIVSGCFPFDGFRLSKFENLSMNELNDALFVQSWQNTSNYTAYFETCKPSECRYTLRDQNNLLYILITVVSLYGGLVNVLRLIISESLYGYRWWTRKSYSQQAPTTYLETMAT